MNKLKELWSSSVFRWFVFVLPMPVFADLVFEDLDCESPFGNNTTTVNIIWICIFILPALWVWRKPIWKLLKQALGFLNKKEEAG
jgi:hypothetical protein